MSYFTKTHLFFCLCLFEIFSIQAQDKRLDSLLNRLKTLTSDTARVNMMNKIAYLYVRENPKIAIEYAAKSLQIAAKNDYAIGEADAYRCFGLTYLGISNYDSSYLFLDKSLQICRKVGDRKRTAKVLNNLGSLNLAQDKAKEALSYFLEGLKILEELNDKKTISSILNNIGGLYSRQLNYDKAIEYYTRSIKISEEIGDKVTLSASLANLATVYENMEKYDKARIYAIKSLTIAREVGNDYNIRGSLFFLGSIYTKLKAYDKANKYFEESKQMSQKAGDINMLISSLNGLALLAQEQSKWEDEIKYSEEALAQCKMINSTFSLTSYHNLYIANEGLGNYKKALEYHILYMAIKDSLFNEENSKQILEIQTKYEVTKKESENKLLKKEQLLKNQEIIQQKLFIFAALLVLGLISILSIILYRSRQREKAINVIMENKQQELEDKNNLLESLINVKDRLFSVISHDLRSPLNSLKGVLNLLNDGSLSIKETMFIFGKLSQEVSNISDLLDNLLQWAKGQLQGIHAKPKTNNLYAISNQVIVLFENMASQKKILFENQISENLFVFADEDMLRTILRNLLSNALKFTKVGGKVTISAESQGESVEIKVKDDGVGMSEDALSKLFTGNITTHGTQNEKGTGLGLMLVKDFVEKNGGKMQVKSTQGEGSSFEFSLPKHGDYTPKDR